MRIALLMVMVALLPNSHSAAPQAGDEEAIKAVVRAQAKAFWSGDADAWQALWLHDANVTRTIVAGAAHQSLTGWDNIAAQVLKDMRPDPNAAERTMDRVIVRQGGNLAWIEWDQRTASQDPKSKDVSREHRLLVKDRGQWKLASQITHATTSLESPMAIENALNSTGYALLEATKLKEAIEVFNVNVRLYPQSWNAYDSLGEAYAVAGQKELAIQNYQKSVELNPKNETGLAALKKLRQH